MVEQLLIRKKLKSICFLFIISAILTTRSASPSHTACVEGDGKWRKERAPFKITTIEINPTASRLGVDVYPCRTNKSRRLVSINAPVLVPIISVWPSFEPPFKGWRYCMSLLAR